jgi:hypothetical protein
MYNLYILLSSKTLKPRSCPKISLLSAHQQPTYRANFMLHPPMAGIGKQNALNSLSRFSYTDVQDVVDFPSTLESCPYVDSFRGHYMECA